MLKTCEDYHAYLNQELGKRKHNGVELAWERIEDGTIRITISGVKERFEPTRYEEISITNIASPAGRGLCYALRILPNIFVDEEKNLLIVYYKP